MYAKLCAVAAVAVIGGGIAVSQALGDEAQAVRQLAWKGGPELSFGLPAKITFTQSPVVRMTVSGPKDVVDRAYVEGGKVRLQPKHRWWFGEESNVRGLRIDASAPHLTDVSVHSSGNLTIPSLSEDALAISVHSAAKATVNARVRTLRASVHSAANLTATGQAERVWLSVHSAARADLGGMAVDYADVSAHSAASAVVKPRVEAKLSAHSGANIRLVSRPETVTTTRHSGASVSVP